MNKMFNKPPHLLPCHTLKMKKPNPNRRKYHTPKAPHIKTALIHLAHVYIFQNIWQKSSTTERYFNSKHPAGESGFRRFQKHRSGVCDLNLNF